MNRVKYISSVFLRMLSLLIGVSIISFILVTNSPIDPLTSYIGAESTLSVEAKEEIADHWGLNDPPLERFASWGKNVLKGDFGTSITYKQQVSTVILERFKYSIVLMLVAWCFSGIVGFLIGVLAGIYKGSLFDKIIKIFCLALQSAPTFWIGLLILSLFSVYLGWFPIGFAVPMGKLSLEITIWDRIYHLILPALTLSILGVANICLHTREKVIEILSSDYILFAKARGESKKSIVFNHVIKNVALPAITLQFLSFSELFAGTVFAEQVFSYPGLGQATVSAGLKGDLPLLMGIVIISLIFVYTGNLIADLIYMLIDPRVKGGSKA